MDLGSLCRFRGGSAFPIAHQGSRTGDFPFVKVSDFNRPGNERVLRDAGNWVSEAALTDLKAKPVPAGCSIFAKIGEGLRAERLRLTSQPTLIDNNLMAAIPNPRHVDEEFLCYLLQTVGLGGYAHGSALPYLRAGDLARISVLVPEVPEQRRIARVLMSLDGLIEGNRQMISDLLAAAGLLFEQVSLQRGAGARELTFGEVCLVLGGGTPSTREPSFWGGEFAWATPTDITALPSPFLFATSRQITHAGLAACASELHPRGSIFMTSRATIGAFAINQMACAVNQGFIVVRPEQEIDRAFLFHEMFSRVDEFTAQANGSTFLELSRSRFKALPVYWPQEDVRRDLSLAVEPLHAAAAELEMEIKQTATVRDELLPLLMSGRVRVGELAA